MRDKEGKGRDPPGPLIPFCPFQICMSLPGDMAIQEKRTAGKEAETFSGFSQAFPSLPVLFPSDPARFPSLVDGRKTSFSPLPFYLFRPLIARNGGNHPGMNRESHGNQFRPGKEKTGGSRFHLKVCLDLQVKITEKFHFLFRSVQQFSENQFCFSAVMSCRKVRRSKKSCKERQDKIRTGSGQSAACFPLRSISERERKIRRGQGRFSPETMQEREKKISQVKRHKLSEAIRKKFLRSKQDGERKPLFFRPLCALFAPASRHSFPRFTPHEKQGCRSKSRPHSRSFFVPGIFSPLTFREPLTASG